MARSDNERIVANAILNTIKTVVGVIFPLVTFPYVTRVLGVEALGTYTFGASLISYFLLISALGISTYGIREGTQYRDDQKKIDCFVSEVFSINLFSTVVSYVFLIVCLVVVPKLHSYSTTILILSMEMIMTTLGVTWVCNIYEDFLFITVRTLAMQFISLILTLTLIKKPKDLYFYVAIIVLANSGSNLFNLFYIRRKYCKFRFTFHINWKKHLKPILIIFSTSVAITVYVSSDTTMLGFMTNDYQVGLYGTAVKVYTIIKNVLAAILMVLIPQFTLMFSSGDKEKSDLLFSKMFNVLTALMLPICVGLFSLSDDVILLISGSEYIGAASSLRLLSIAVIFSLYAYMYTQCVLIPIKEEKIVFRATSISAFVNIGLNLILIPIWGIDAAAVTTIIAEFITFLVAFFYSRKTVKLIAFGKNLISTLIGCFCIFLTCLACRTMDSLPVRVVVSVLGSIMAYVIALVLSKNPVLGQLKEMILKQR